MKQDMKFTERLEHMALFLVVPRLDITHTTDTESNIVTCRYKHILKPPIINTQ